MSSFYTHGAILTAIADPAKQAPAVAAAAAVMLREPEANQTVVLGAAAKLANSGIRNLGPALAFEIVAAIAMKMAQLERTE